MSSTTFKPPTKAEKRATLKALVSGYAELMYPNDQMREGTPDHILRENAERAYRLAARIVDMGIDLGLYR